MSEEDHYQVGEKDQPNSENWFVQLSVWIFCPIAAAMYFLQFEGAFKLSISSILESAKLEREFLLTPSSSFDGWGEHYIYRFVATVISIVIVAFMCGGLTRKNGKRAGLIGGLVISGILALPFILPGMSNENLGTDFLIVTVILVFLSPGIGLLAGPAGVEFALTRVSGFAGVPRLHFLWLWVPAYHYGLILITPLARFIKSTYGEPQNILVFIVTLLPILVYGAPLLIGMAVISGNLFTGLWSWVRQIIGSVIIIGGIVAVYMFQYWLAGFK